MIRALDRRWAFTVLSLGVAILLLASLVFKQQHDLAITQRRLDALIHGNQGGINLNHALIDDQGQTVQQLIDEVSILRQQVAADTAADRDMLIARIATLQETLNARIAALERRTLTPGTRGPMGPPGAHGVTGSPAPLSPAAPMIITPPGQAGGHCPLGRVGPVCIVRTF